MQVNLFPIYNTAILYFFIILCNYFKKGYVTIIRCNFAPIKALQLVFVTFSMGLKHLALT